MQYKKVSLKSTLEFIKKQWFIPFVAVIYVISTASAMGPGFTDCKNSIYGFGDSTAGPIWRNSLQPDQPLLGGYEKSTNFPTGESLYSPVGYVSLVQTFTMKLGSKVVGPVCAYNLYNIVGYLSTALLMFFFVAYLIRSRWIALLAGFAVAFTPYVQSKVGGHPSYGYASLLIAALWLSLQVIATGKKRYAIMLGVILAMSAYFDPYFILLVITTVVPVFAIWGYVRLRQVLRLKSESRRVEVKRYFKSAVVLIATFSILFAPLLVVRIRDAAIIESSVGNVRGNVVDAAMQCSNKPIDYLLPDPTNIYLVKILGGKYTAKNIDLRNWCGYGESRVSISITMLTIIMIGFITTLWMKYKGQLKGWNTLTRYNTGAIVGSVGAIAVFAFLLGLPPYLQGFITPSGIVLEITSMWRIFAREYLVLNLAICILFAIALKYLSVNLRFLKSTLVKAVIFLLIVLGIVLEYQINEPFGPMTFNYNRDVPKVYEQIKNDPDIKAIAEYPIDRMGLEYDSAVYYVTMQAVHKKSILNSIAIKDSNETIHVALKDLSDPQTIPALRYLGINYVVIHGEKAEDILRIIPGLKLLSIDNPVVYGLRMVREDDTNQIILAKLPEVTPTPNLLTIEKGYVVNLPLIHSPINIEYELVQDAELQAKDLSNKNKGSFDVCFEAKMSVPSDKSSLTVIVNGRNAETMELNGNYKKVALTVDKGSKIRLNNSKGYNMRLNNLGCRE